jgi:hypothetical protein
MRLTTTARKSMHAVLTAAVTLVFALVSGPCQPALASDGHERGGGTLTLYHENDVFTGTENDKDYTSGVKLSWTSPDLGGEDGETPAWGHELIDHLPFREGPGYLRTISLSVGQSMYTPEDITRREPKEGDRPYAGITYFSVGFQSRNTHVMDTWEFTLGTVGPHSYAYKVQKSVHRWTNSYYPKGWDSQIEDEPILNISRDRKWRLYTSRSARGMGFDFIPHAGGCAGNAYTGINGGGQVRYGLNLPNDFGTFLIRPCSDTNAPIDEKDPRFKPLSESFGIHLFAGLDVRWCIWNITLDGNSFRTSDHVDKRPIVADFAGGLGMNWGKVKLTMAYVLRTKEYYTQREKHLYGSATISYTFD